MNLIGERKLSELEQQGVIHAFEYNYELAWNVLKVFYDNQGEQNIQRSRDAIKLAFKRGLIINGDIYLSIIKSRALTSHTYNEETTHETLKTNNHQPSLLIEIGLALDEQDLLYIFDLSVYDKISNPDLISHIDRIGVVFYEKDS